jgi:glycosyltransferase involved in cell wall biosynthesis
VPYLLRPHGTLDPYIHRRHRWRKRVVEHLFQDRVLRQAAAVHYITKEEQELAAPYVHGAPGTVVPLGLNLADYDQLPDPAALARRYPQCAGRKVILFFGRLNFKKGLDLLTEAFGQILRQRPDVHLLLVGPDGGMRAQTEAWLRANGTLEQATFTDMLLGEEKLEVLAGSDLFVLPSYSENFGIAVIEAMACGLPVVISDRVNLWREVQAADAGRIIPPTADACAKALLEVLADPEAARQMGVRGRDLVQRAFNWDAIGHHLVDAYHAILAAQNQPPNQENKL